MIQRHYTAAEQSERKARIAAYVAAHPGTSPHAVAAALGIPRTSVRRHMATVKFCVGKTANPMAVDVAATPGNFQRVHVPIWRGESLAGAMVERFRG